MSTETDITRLIDRMFAGDEAQPREVAVVATALGSDDDAREYYNRVARVDAEFGGDLEQRFGEAWFLHGVDEMLAQEAAGNQEAAQKLVRVDDVPANRNRPLGMWLSAAALLLVAFAGVVAGDRVPTEEFSVRSAAPADATGYAATELGVFCVTRDGDDIRFRSPRDFEFGTVRCPLDAEIKLAARTSDERLRWGAFLGVAADGTMTWYGPSPAAPGAVPIEHAQVLRPIGETIRLNVNHEIGPTRVVGIFSEERLEWSDVERIVRRNGARLTDGPVLIEHAVVARQTFEVTP